MRNKSGNAIKEQPTKANCSTIMEYGSEMGSYSVNRILGFIQGGGENVVSDFNVEKLTELRHLFGIIQGQAAKLLGSDINKLIKIEGNG